MNNRISVRRCTEYNPQILYELISEIYKQTKGPELAGKKVLLKPNILSDTEPEKCVSTHPAVLEAVVRFCQNEGATVMVGDSPAVHKKGFRPEISGLMKVCEDTGAEWIDFMIDPEEILIRNRSIRIASCVKKSDLIISIPKFKTHELMYFTGAIKNNLGLIPGFSKAIQHGINMNRNEFGEFLVDLCEAVTPEYFLMDGVIGMEGPGPGTKGIPVEVGVLLGSTNPLIMDLVASKIAGYSPMAIPTTRSAFFRRKWLISEEDIVYDGPELNSLIMTGFRRIPVSGNTNSGLRFVLGRTSIARRLERRPVFQRDQCTGCQKCVDICPSDAIQPSSSDNNIVLTDKKCIRCFCCAEVCTENAVDIRVKMFGV